MSETKWYRKVFTLKNIILLACLVSTAYAEHALAVWVGWDEWIACTLPGVCDVYLIHATKSRKDMVYAVLVVIAVNAASYAVTSPWDWTRSLISIGVSILAPIVLWRLHVTEDHRAEMLWGKEAAQAVHEQRDNGWVYEFIPADFPRSLPHAGDVPEPTVDETPEPVKDETPAAPELTDEQRETAIYNGFCRSAKASEVAKEVGVSPATVYRRYSAYKQELVTA